MHITLVTPRGIGIFSLAMGLLLVSSSLLAQISVSKAVLEFTSDRLIQDVDVQNNADYTIYLRADAARINDPGSDNPVRIELDDPRTAEVLVSPRQLAVPAGQRKRIRVILKSLPESSDEIYRLAIKPFVGDLVVDRDERAEKQSVLKILLGYDLLLIARPSNIKVDLDVKRTQDSITFKNEGNTNILLRRLTQCNSAGEDCTELQPSRVYAGKSYQVKLPKSGSAAEFPVKVWQSIGITNEVDVF